MASQDVEALMLAALADPELAPHIDRSRVSVLGWSSGGNLARTYFRIHFIPFLPVALMY